MVITPRGSLLRVQELTLLTVTFVLTYKRDIKSILIHLANEQRLNKCNFFTLVAEVKRHSVILSYDGPNSRKKCFWRLWAARNLVISNEYTNLAFNGFVVTDERKPLRCVLRGTPHRVYWASTEGKSWQNVMHACCVFGRSRDEIPVLLPVIPVQFHGIFSINPGKCRDINLYDATTAVPHPFWFTLD
jgi:hypothetical protein